MLRSLKVQLSLTAITWLLCSAQPAWALTIGFEELPQLLQEQNLHVQGHQSFVDAAAARTKHFQRSFLPELNVHGGGESFKTLTESWRSEPVAGAEANINLLRGGRDYLEESIRKKQLSLESTKATKHTNQQLKRARDLFIHALYFQELRRSYKAALSRNWSHIKLVKQRIDSGLTTETDKIDFQIERSRLKQELAMIDEDHEHAVELLQAILGIELTENFKLRGKLSHKHNDALFKAEFDPDAHKDVSILKKKSQMTSLAKKQANLWWTPSLDVYSSYNLYPFRERERFSLRERDEIVAGFQVKMNLFDGLHSFSKAKSLQLQSQGHQLHAEQKKRELEAKFRKLQHTLKLRHQLVHDVRRSVQRTREYLKRTREEYELGTKNSPDVLSASQRILDQKRRYSDIRRDFLLTKNELLVLLGR